MRQKTCSSFLILLDDLHMRTLHSSVWSLRSHYCCARTSAISWCCRPSNISAGIKWHQTVTTKRACVAQCSPQWQNIATRTDFCCLGMCRVIHFCPSFTSKNLSKTAPTFPQSEVYYGTTCRPPQTGPKHLGRSCEEMQGFHSRAE